MVLWGVEPYFLQGPRLLRWRGSYALQALEALSSYIPRDPQPKGRSKIVLAAGRQIAGSTASLA